VNNTNNFMVFAGIKPKKWREPEVPRQACDSLEAHNQPAPIGRAAGWASVEVAIRRANRFAKSAAE